MTQGEIIRMAREAGFHIENWSFGERVSVYESGKTIDITNELKDFAALVAAHEREACAKVCDDYIDRLHEMRDKDDSLPMYQPELAGRQAGAGRCAAAIRDRKEK